jgi:hypothetical protein
MTKIGINQEQDKHCGNQQQVVNIESLMGTSPYKAISMSTQKTHLYVG